MAGFFGFLNLCSLFKNMLLIVGYLLVSGSFHVVFGVWVVVRLHLLVIVTSFFY